jgi:hypothetical protein
MTAFGTVRELIDKYLGKAEKEEIRTAFGGDCFRIADVLAILETECVQELWGEGGFLESYYDRVG